MEYLVGQVVVLRSSSHCVTHSAKSTHSTGTQPVVSRIEDDRFHRTDDDDVEFLFAIANDDHGNEGLLSGWFLFSFSECD